jgi:hypothetical protein
MKTLKLCLTTVALAAISSCGPAPALVPANHPVTVTNCKPSQDPVEVQLNDTVQWTAPTYAVHFKSRTPFSTKDPPITQQNLVKGDFWCNHFDLGCYYKYVITENGGKICADPGVHVGSGRP